LQSFATVSVLTALILVGCEMDGSSSPGDPGRVESPRDRADQTQEQAVDPMKIDDDAEVAKNFSPGEFEWTADAAGTVWVYDLRNRKVIDTTTLRRGEVLKVSPEADRIWVDGDTRSRNRMFEDADHRVYFLPSARDRNDRQRGRDRSGPRGQEDTQELERDGVFGPRSPDRRDPPRPDDAIRDDRIRDDRPRPDPSVGPVAPARFPGVPAGTQVVAQGKATIIPYRATRNGVAFVVNATTEETVVTYDLKKGQRLTVDVAADQIVIDGRAQKMILSSKSTYQILFKPSS